MKSFNKFRIESLTQIDELNRDTVYSYAKKARDDQDNQSTITDRAYRANDPKTANKAHHKFTMRAAGLDRVEKRLGEEKDPEYSDPYMAVNQLKTIMHNAEEMIELIGDDTDLPEWVESKITLAEDYVMTVANYMRSELKEESVLEGKRGLWDNIHAKQKRIKAGSGEHMRTPGSKGAPTADALRKSATEGMAEGSLEEVSQDTARSYAQKAQASQKDLINQTYRKGADTDALNKKIKNRQQGMDRAHTDKRYYKDELGVAEEVEQIFDEIEELFTEIAEANSVDPEVIWEHYEDVSDEELFETAAWRRKEGKDPKGGLNRKGIASYRRENPGSKLSMAVTTKPSKLKPGSKAANRRKSFCARMGGMPGSMKKPNGEPSRKALALRKWNC